MKTVKMNSGYEIPMVGLGTWQVLGDQVGKTIRVALEAGYRHIDCAHMYENEADIGRALAEAISRNVVRREDVFITSKLWCTSNRPELVRKSFETTLKNLGTPYLDLYLIHCPMAFKASDDLFPTDENGKVIWEDVDYLDTYKELEKLVKVGLVRSIGVANFNTKQIQRVLDNCEICPANVQVEINAYFPNKELVKFCHERGISITGYSPLGSPNRPWATEKSRVLIKDPKVIAIAERVGKTPAQVLLRWNIQRGVIVIPKSVTPERIRSNLQVFDFTLSEEDMSTLSNLGYNRRAVPFHWTPDAPNHPFPEDI